MAATTRVYVTKDRLSARVDCIVDSGNVNETVADVLVQSATMGIDPPLKAANIQAALLAAASSGPHVAGLVLSQGTPPIPSVPGSLSWERDFFSAPFVENPKTGRVDYRQHLDNSIVASGDIIATLTPPKPGTPGLDVFGKTIAVAKPGGPNVRAGEGVEFDGATNTFVATTIGRVRFAKGVLSVDRTYSVKGSIGIKTGHVNYPGAVDVAKDVEPDSILEAGGTVHVAGAAEECIIEAGGDVLIGHGIIGGGKTKVHAGGSIEAAFAERAEIVAGHDVRIRRELIQCLTNAHGAVLIPDGQIIGGRVNAVFGIDAGQVGSHGDVPTTLIAGVDATLQEQIASRHADADECHEEIVQLNERIAPFKARESTLSSYLKDKMDALLRDLAKAEARLEQTTHELEQLTAQSNERAKSVIRIRRKVYPDTHLRIAYAKLDVEREMDGPLVARLNDEGELVLEPDSSA
ncbi:MAG: DUF342 domain-containing protein [Candidatus Hydrogenedentes bacterium]|nr:DUF342 domain-containing protein [Candidatus Hydrogenedentota bacterium]